MTYLQAGQYKLLKAYRSISAQERRERLVNSITSAIRRSLDPNEIFKVAVEELGQAMQVCRCLIYRCKATDAKTTITYEYRSDLDLPSLVGHEWSLVDNPLFQIVAQRHESFSIPDTQTTNLDLSDVQKRLDAFTGPCPDGMEACHANGDRSDNRAGNLRWDTVRENANDRISHHPTCRRRHRLEGPNLLIVGAARKRRCCG